MTYNTIMKSFVKDSTEFILRYAHIILCVAYFTAVFDDGFLWIAIFGAGFYFGTRCGDQYE